MLIKGAPGKYVYDSKYVNLRLHQHNFPKQQSFRVPQMWCMLGYSKFADDSFHRIGRLDFCIIDWNTAAEKNVCLQVGC